MSFGLPAIATAQSSAEIEKVRAKVRVLATNKDSQVEVKFRDRTKLKGYIDAGEALSFTLRHPKDGTSQSIAYSEVDSIDKAGSAVSTKTWLIIGGVRGRRGYNVAARQTRQIGALAPKGRVQDAEYNHSPVVEELLAYGKQSILYLISKLDDETKLDGHVVDYWEEVRVGDIALMILSDFFTNSSWQNTTIPGVGWDKFLEHGVDRNLTGERLCTKTQIWSARGAEQVSQGQGRAKRARSPWIAAVCHRALKVRDKRCAFVAPAELSRFLPDTRGYASLAPGYLIPRLWRKPSSGVAQTLSGGRLSTEVVDDPVYRFTRETFEPYVGGYFEAPGARGKMVALKLVKVDSYDAEKQTLTRAAVATDSFSFLLSADGELPAFSSIHPIKHGALGEFDLFLTRRDGPNGEIRYEAVFNHLK